MNLIANKLFTQAISSVFTEAGKIYSNNPDCLLEINTALTRIVFELEKLQNSQEDYEDEWVSALES